MALFNINKTEFLRWVMRYLLDNPGWYIRNKNALTNHYEHVTFDVFHAQHIDAYWIFARGRKLNIKILVSKEDESYGYISSWYEHMILQEVVFKDDEEEWEWLKTQL